MAFIIEMFVVQLLVTKHFWHFFFEKFVLGLIFD